MTLESPSWLQIAELPDTNMISMISPLIAFQLLFLCLGFQSTHTTTNVTVTNTIQPGQSLTTSDTIVSPNGNFQLCFYSPKFSTKYYLVVRYKKVSEQNVVWVANREYGFIDSSVVLKINQDGDLVISDSRIYSPLTNTSAGNGTYAMLLNTGNFVLTDRGFEVLWQSFDHPTDTLLPGMILGRYDWSLKSWKNKEDPAPGNFSLKLEYSYRLTLMEGSKVYWSIPIDSFDFLSDDWEYVTWPVNKTSQTQFSRIMLDEYGKLKLQSWSEDEQQWNSSLQSSGCGDYVACGTFSICNETAQDPCGCLPGFKPVSADVSSKGNVSRDCARKTALRCSNNSDVQNDGFLPMSRIDWLDSPLSFDIGSGKECESACLNNCSCIAYAYEDNYRSHKNKSKCLVWTGSLSYLKQLPDDDIYGLDFFLKLSLLDLLTNGKKYEGLLLISTVDVVSS